MMQARANGRGTWLVWAAVWVAACVTAQANGFRNPPEGAAALGATGMKTALLSDPTAIAHNPANLVDLAAPQVLGTLTLIHGEVDYDGASGSGSTREPWKMLPSLFYAAPLADFPVTVGLGLTSPYGQSTEWEEDGPFMFTAPYLAELRTVDIRPVFAYRASDRFSLAAGPDVVYSDLTLKQWFPWGMVTGNPAQAPGNVRLEGDGLGLGGTVALSWRPAPGHRVGLSYHSRVKVDYEGDLDVSNLPPPSALPGPLDIILAGNSDFDSEITFPTVVSLGYGVSVSETVRLGVDLEWVEFSTFDELPLDVGRNAPLLPADRAVQDWDDTWVVALGGEYDLSETLTLRGGYVYLESPVPEQTLSPTLPDTDRHLLTAGLAAATGPHALGLTYAYSLYDDLDVTGNANPLYNGSYDIDTHVVTLTYAYAF